ncbi:hypothetical protein CPC08DRAFT_505392 [Agrocybe pediades]|nr:hypothetical protein CPC08DRAFT_505392 [Agrocybe pediades]
MASIISTRKLFLPLVTTLQLFITSTVFAQNITLPVGLCTADIPCSNGACCNSVSGFCGFGPAFCTPVAQGGPCTSHCDALAECGPFAAASNRTCPLNVCCSQFGFCGTTEEFCGTGCQSNCNPPGQQSCGADQQSALQRRIGYYEGWAPTRGCSAYPPESISAETLTHVNFAFALISDTYQIIEMSPGDRDLWTRTTALKKRNLALKVFLSIGGWTFNDSPTQHIFSNLVGSDANIQTFIADALNVMQAYSFDGLDIDWEYPVAAERGGVPADKERYPVFMSKVKAAFKSRGYGLSFTAPSSYWYLQHFDLPALMQSADWVNVMTYDLHGTWDGTDPYIGNVVLAHTNLTEIKQTMQLFANVGVNPSQIVLGIGFYGRSFELADGSCNAPGCPFVGGADPGPCSASSGTLMFSEIENIISANSLSPTYDDVDAVKYIVWNQNQWVSYDDAQTLAQKLQYANTICLGGTMIWSVDQDDSQYTALGALYGDVNINKPSSTESGNLCQTTGCGQSCPAGFEALTTVTQIPGIAGSCPTNNPARLCCPVGLEPQGCHWSGGGGSTCNAQCDVGEIVMALDETGGDGKPTCVQGYKAFCCKSGQLDPGDCFAGGCFSDSCASGYQVQTRVKQGSQDNGGCENQGPLVKNPVCPQVCQSNTKPVCCQEGFGYNNCEWVGDPPNCFNAVCRPGQVALFSDMQGDASQSCTSNKRLYCCDPPSNAAFLPVPEEWVFPSQSPVGSGYSVHQPATFTVDFDDNTGTSDSSQRGVGSSGTGDDGRENDSPFGEVFISSPNAGSVSSLDIAADWVIPNCDPTSDQEQKVAAYCARPIDDEESGCGHVFIDGAKDTIVRLPKTCGLGPYARVVSLELHHNQSTLDAHHAKRAQSDVYLLHFDYNFAAIPSSNGPVLMRADLTDIPGYWDAMINSAPDDGTTTTRRSTNRKREFHQPEELEKRWFGPFDRWLQKLTTITLNDQITRNFHWSDSYTIFHQEEQCPNFSSSLDITISGTAQVTSAFGYYLEASVVPPAIQQAYVYVKAGAGAQATFSIVGLAEAQFDSERLELVSFGFPGLYYPGLLTIGPSLHLYGQLTGHLSFSGKFSTSVGYDFPPFDMAFGKQDGNGDEEVGFKNVSPNNNNQGYDFSVGYNVNLEGGADAHLIPSFQLGISVLGGSLLDAQAFVEADLFAGVSINGSVSSTSAPQFCVSPHFGVSLNAGLTGSVLFWRDNALSVPLYNPAPFPFGEKCFSSQSQLTRREDGSQYGYNALLKGHQGTVPDYGHDASHPAYMEYKHPSGQLRRALPSTKKASIPSKADLESKKMISRRAVPFLPGALFCPATGADIADSPNGSKQCFISQADLDPNQIEDRLARRADLYFDRDILAPFTNTTTHSAHSPFHVLEEAKLAVCPDLKLPIPTYSSVPISAYFDLAFPGELTGDIEAYTPDPPVALGGKLVVRPGAAVYAREHVFEQSMGSLAIDFLSEFPALWENAAGTMEFCDWVRDNLVNSPAYYAGNVFNEMGSCYPRVRPASNGPQTLQQSMNVIKNLALFSTERQFLPGLGGAKPFMSPTTFENSCATVQTAVIRAHVATMNYMNNDIVRRDFQSGATCIRNVLSRWQTAYRAANVDAPDRDSLDVVTDIYNPFIKALVQGIPAWLTGEMNRYINSLGNGPLQRVDLSLFVLTDNEALEPNLNPGGNVPFSSDQTIQIADLRDLANSMPQAISD